MQNFDFSALQINNLTLTLYHPIMEQKMFQKYLSFLLIKVLLAICLIWRWNYDRGNSIFVSTFCCARLNKRALIFLIIPPATKLQGGILVSPCPSVGPSVCPPVCLSVRLQTNPMSYDNLSCVSQNLLKLYQLFTGEERRIPFIFDDFHFCRSRVIGLDMTENRMFTLCRMIT